MELKRYWEIIWRRKLLLMLVVLSFPLFLFVLMKITVPVYTSQGEIWIKVSTMPPKFDTSLPSKMGDLGFTYYNNALGTLESFFESNAVVGPVIRDLRLVDKDGNAYLPEEFVNPGKIGILKQKMGVGIEKVTDSDVFKITGYSSSPEQAKEIANRVIKSFSKAFADMYRNDAVIAKKVMKTRLADVQRRLLSAEAVLESYKTKSSAYDTTEQVKSLIADISNLESNKKSSFLATLAQLQVEKTPEHPDVKIVLDQIKTVNDQIRERQKRLNELTEKAGRYDELSREVTNLKAAYNTLSVNMEAVESAFAMDLTNIFVIQSPTLFEPMEYNRYFPPRKKSVGMIVASLLGFFLGLLIIFLLEYLDASIGNAEQVKKLHEDKNVTHLPIGGMPLSPEEISDTALMEPLYDLVVQMKPSTKNGTGYIISVVSPSEGEGTTTVAAFLAAVFADLGKKTLLLDGDLRQPMQHRVFNLPQGPGFSDCLAGECSPKDAVAHSTLADLQVMVGGTHTFRYPQHAVATRKLDEIFNDLTAQYEIIILDSPPYQSGSDALSLAKHAHETIVVMAQGKTHKQRAADIMKSLAASSITVNAIVINHAVPVSKILWVYLCSLTRRRK